MYTDYKNTGSVQNRQYSSLQKNSCSAFLLLVLPLLMAACTHVPPAVPSAAIPSAVVPAVSENAATKVSDSTALAVTRRLFLVDSHIDYPERAKAREDVSIRTSGDFDYPRALAGGLDLAFIVAFVSPENAAAGVAFSMAEERINLTLAMEAVHPELFALATSPADALAAGAAGKLALAIGIENGDALEGRLERVAWFKDRSVAYITLTHVEDNSLCDSSTGTGTGRRWGGLSPFGREVVAEMNRLGLMIDLAHATEETVFQVLDLSAAPIIVSHTGVQQRTPGFTRNLSDEALRAVAAAGGVIQMAFGSSFVSDRYRKTYAASDLATVADVADAIHHAVTVAGIRHVGIGSDFDGVGYSLPVILRDVSMYPNLVRELLQLGYSEDDLALIFGGNLLRVWEQVLALAEGGNPEL